MCHRFSSDLDDPEAFPYFLWDAPMTNAELQRKPREGHPFERVRLLGKILREANDTECWRYITPQEFEDRWSELSPHLGRRRAFWRYMLDEWKKMDLIHG